MATSIIPLKAAKKGQRITVSAVKGYGRSSAAVKLRDDKTVYTELKYSSGDYLMGQKSFKYNGDGPLVVELDIIIDGKPAVDKALFGITELKGAKGDVKCTAWTIAAEDLPNDDDDFADLVVSVVATNKY